MSWADEVRKAVASDLAEAQKTVRKQAEALDGLWETVHCLRARREALRGEVAFLKSKLWGTEDRLSETQNRLAHFDEEDPSRKVKEAVRLALEYPELVVRVTNAERGITEW